MTERIKKMLNGLKNKEYTKNYSWIKRENERVGDESLSKFKLMAKAFEMNCKNEQPYFHEYDSLGFNRKLNFLKYYNGDVPFWRYNGNFAPDYEGALNGGFKKYNDTIKGKMKNCTDHQRDLYEAMLEMLGSAQSLANRYKEAAKNEGRTDIYEALCIVPENPPQSYYQALVFLKFMIYIFRLNQNNHVTIGRFDQYMFPFYDADIKRGVKREKLLEQTEEFFISINYDSHFYAGVQRGDNGQSMLLGGCDKDGNDAFNDLSRLCMEASLELNIIDPKINLRVNKKTPIEILEFATLMTKQGMGFPQYCNDDIVIPGLVKLGYDLEDARDYSVAACWEFIIPAKATDWPNMKTMNFPLIVERTCKEKLLLSKTFDDFMLAFKDEMEKECAVLAEGVTADFLPDPFLSMFIKDCIEQGKDVSQHGAKYNNDGCHGAGISTAADSLCAIKTLIFDENVCTKEELLKALEANFEGYGELRNKMLSCAKMGNDDDSVDNIAIEIMKYFSDSMNNRKSARGGIFRAGTGSAMEYIISAEKVGATPDGRYAKSPYGSSFSPAFECRLDGVISCIKSFTKYDMSEIINGGPLTLEMHSSIFRNDEGIKKVATLVKYFIDRGGHQLQLNSVNREVLINAQKNPEEYKNLIVRVWGWSGYFTELAKEYQDHIIKRNEFEI